MPFLIGPILLALEGGSYVGPILLGALAEIFIRKLIGGSGDISGGSGDRSGRRSKGDSRSGRKKGGAGRSRDGAETRGPEDGVGVQ